MPTTAYVYQIPERGSYFDVEKVRQTAKIYNENHPGLTLVIGHPFEDEAFLEKVLFEQQRIKEIFEKYHLAHLLQLYEKEQIHATVIELASQHDELRNTQESLSEKELNLSKKGELIQINFAVEWLRRSEPFDVELGMGVLSEEHQDQTIRITSNGQIVMKGRARKRNLLSKVRGAFEDEARHKYGREDDESDWAVVDSVQKENACVQAVP